MNYSTHDDSNARFFDHLATGQMHKQIPVRGADPASFSASATQVGGDHYKQLTVEPWDAMEAWLSPAEFVGFLRGNIIKYHARAHTKNNPEENIRKANHYAKKLEEVMAKQEAQNPQPVK